MLDRGIQDGVHYLDDYLFLALRGRQAQSRVRVGDLRGTSGTVTVQKLEGQSTCVVFLGLELDTEKQEIRFPAEKLDKVRGFIRLWQACKKCSKEDLLSLVGLLHHGDPFRAIILSSAD